MLRFNLTEDLVILNLIKKKKKKQSFESFSKGAFFNHGHDMSEFKKKIQL